MKMPCRERDFFLKLLHFFLQIITFALSFHVFR